MKLILDWRIVKNVRLAIEKEQKPPQLVITITRWKLEIKSLKFTIKAINKWYYAKIHRFTKRKLNS